MSTAKSVVVESINQHRLRGLSPAGRQIQPAQRLERIRNMASALLEEAESLEHQAGLAESAASVDTLNDGRGVDFFDEVRQFEVRLIKRALQLADGNQARAARLLGLRTTTLNYKIKTYQLA